MPIQGVLHIYSNDGTTLLQDLSAIYGVPFEIVETGINVGGTDDKYIYSGDKKFIGVATSANATTPTYAVGDMFLIESSDMIVYIVEGEVNASTDLTNTKWKINSGWLAPSGYGIFKLRGSVKYSSFEENFNAEGFAIGYEWYVDGPDFYFKKKENVVSNSWTGSISNDNELIIDIIEGNDVTNTSLISWLETYGEQIVEEQPTEYTLRIDGVEVTDYENVIVNGVSYKCKKGASIPTDLTGYTVTLPAGWSASSGYGQFNIIGDLISDDFYGSFSFNTLAVGYTFVGFLYPYGDNALLTRGPIYQELNNQYKFTIVVEGGNDVSNPSLIQWFVDNNATFTKIPHSGGA